MKKRWTGVATCLISLVWAFLAWKIIIPGFMPGNNTASHFISRWHHLGSGYLEIVENILVSPGYVLKRIFSHDFLNIFTSLFFVPLLAPEILLLIMPGAVLNLTSDFDVQATFSAHYAAPLTFFVIWSFIAGLKRAQKFFQARTRVKIDGTLILTLFCLIVAAFTFGAHYDFYSLDSHTVSVRKMLKEIPVNSVVCAQTGFVPHLVRKTNVIEFPGEKKRNLSYRDASYVAVDIKGNPLPLNSNQLENLVNSIREDKEHYQQIYFDDGIYLFKRKENGSDRFSQSE